MTMKFAAFMCAHLALFSFLISIAVCGITMSARVVDHYKDDGGDAAQLPTCGGLGIVAGLAVSLLCIPVFYPNFFNYDLMAQIGSLVFATGLLGVFDDVYEINAKIKFGFLFILSCAGVTVCGAPTSIPYGVVDLQLPVIIAFAGSVLWVFTIANAVNFMDGINGMLCTVMTVAFAGLGGLALWMSVPTITMLAWAIAAGLAGLAVYNWRNHARIFAGDTGSLICGVLFALLSLELIEIAPVRNSLLGPISGNGLVYVGPLLVLPLLIDVLLTLLKSVRQGANILKPHRRHVYQRITRVGYSHVQISGWFGLFAFWMGLYVWIGAYSGLIRSVYFFALPVLLGSVFYYMIDRALSRNGIDTSKN